MPLTRRRLLVSWSATLIASTLVACGPSAPTPTSTGGPAQTNALAGNPARGGPNTVIFGARADASQLNPILPADRGGSVTVSELLFDPLIRLDPVSGAPGPALAQSSDVSPDGRSITFHMRPASPGPTAIR